MKVGDLLRDKLVPTLTGIIVRVDLDKKNPYTIFCEGYLVECDDEYVEKYCELAAESKIV